MQKLQEMPIVAATNSSNGTVGVTGDKYYAGAISGVIEVLFTHPVDYVKTKHQEFTQKSLKFSSREFYGKIYNGNIFNFYTGLMPRIVGIIPMRLIFWGVQGSTKEYLQTRNIKSKYNFVAIGSLSGFAQSIVDNPIEVIKISTMTGKRVSFKNLFKMQGFTPTLYRNVAFANCIAFTTCGFEHKDAKSKFLASAIGGLVGSVLTQPFDYVKTLKQRSEDTRINNKSVRSLSTSRIMMEVYKANKSVKPLYSGVTARSVLSFLTMGIGFVAYDSILEFINK